MTIEEIEVAINEVHNHFKDAEYQMDGTACQVAISAMQRQIPQKPIWVVLSKYKNGNAKNGDYKCPTCLRIGYVRRRDALDTHCGFCGQAIEWSGVEE